jgi:hypothetical protein
MNAAQARELVVSDYQIYLDEVYKLIAKRSKDGFYNITLKTGIWCVDSDLTRVVCQKLEKEGYNTYFRNNKTSGVAYTVVMW